MWVCMFRSGSVVKQVDLPSLNLEFSYSLYSLKWVCSVDEWVCTVSSGSVLLKYVGLQYRRVSLYSVQTKVGVGQVKNGSQCR